MKQSLLLLLPCIFYTSAIIGQTSTKKSQYKFAAFLKPSYKEPEVKFGFKVGSVISNMNFNKGIPAPPKRSPASWKPGFNLGLFMEVPVYTNLAVQPEYLYQQLYGSNSINGTNYYLSYLSLPVVLKYKLSTKFALLAGPQFDLLIKSTEDVAGIRSNITHDTEERSIAANAGLEFSVIEKLSVCARYTHGFNHIGIGQRSNVTEFKFEMVQLSAALKF
jgi:opacity protein-like surface antigen